MYEYLKGKLISQDPLKVVVDINGIGYKLHVPLSSLSHLPPLGKEVIFYTKFVVREDSQTLYGFTSPQERNLFEKVINVSGIGPKTGLALLGHLDSVQFNQAIQVGDVRLISKVPGIGKKTAERLIIEMRDHLDSPNLIAPAIGALSSGKNSVVTDALQGLMSLGYSAIQAQKAIQSVIKKIGEPSDAAQLITHALKKEK